MIFYFFLSWRFSYITHTMLCWWKVTMSESNIWLHHIFQSHHISQYYISCYVTLTFTWIIVFIICLQVSSFHRFKTLSYWSRSLKYCFVFHNIFTMGGILRFFEVFEDDEVLLTIFWAVASFIFYLICFLYFKIGSNFMFLNRYLGFTIW